MSCVQRQGKWSAGCGPFLLLIECFGSCVAQRGVISHGGGEIRHLRTAACTSARERTCLIRMPETHAGRSEAPSWSCMRPSRFMPMLRCFNSRKKVETCSHRARRVKGKLWISSFLDKDNFSLLGKYLRRRLISGSGIGGCGPGSEFAAVPAWIHRPRLRSVLL